MSQELGMTFGMERHEFCDGKVTEEPDLMIGVTSKEKMTEGYPMIWD